MKEDFKGSKDAPMWEPDEAQAPKETVLERPDLWIGTNTLNIFLIKGEYNIYVRIGALAHIGNYSDMGGRVPRVGDKRHRGVFGNDMLPYTGPIDDEMMANILMFGG